MGELFIMLMEVCNMIGFLRGNVGTKLRRDRNVEKEDVPCVSAPS